jgi:hypothetical protein
METNWFRKVGWFYYPTSIIGVVISILGIVFCVTVFNEVDQTSHSVSDTLYGIFPYFVSVFTILFWIAGNTSGKEK